MHTLIAPANFAVQSRETKSGFPGESRNSCFLHAGTAVVLALLCVAAPAVQAAADKTDTLQLTLTASILHDDNLFRQSDNRLADPDIIPGRSASDTITRLGVGLKYDNTISRQHVIGEINLVQNSYRENSDLDHVSGRAAARWLWQVGNYWSGELSYDYTRRISNFSDVRIRIKNFIDQDVVVATAGYQFHPRWRAHGYLSWLESENSSPLLFQNDTEITTSAVGLDYKTPAGNTVGMELRYADGSYPNREAIAARFINNQYEETTASAVFLWGESGISRYYGKVGYTQRRQAQFSQRDFDGPTFFLQHTWLPSGKFTLVSSLWRLLWTTELETASYVVASGIRLVPSWHATSKITIRGMASYEHRSYEGDPGIVIGVPTREDNVRTLQASAVYALHRNAEVFLTLESGTRDSNRPGSDYEYNTAGVSLRLRF